MARLLLIATLLLALPCLAQDGPARRYAVLSLVGDRLLVVQREMSTGSRIDRNARTFLPLPTPALDHEALFAVEDALKASQPGATVVLLAARDPALFAAQSRLLDEGGTTQSFLPAVKGALAGANATHLVLVTKYRHEARLQLRDGTVGSGSLEGLGFYIDAMMRVTDRQTGEESQGFLAPFAYFRLSLIDLATGRVEKETTVVSSRSASSQSRTPWEALSAEQKVRILRDLIRTETAQAMPQIVAR